MPSLKNPQKTPRLHKRARLALLRRLARHLLTPQHPLVQIGLRRLPLVMSLSRVPLLRSLLPAHPLYLPRHLPPQPVRMDGSIWLFSLFHPSRAGSRSTRRSHPTVQRKSRRKLPGQVEVHSLIRVPRQQRRTWPRSLTSMRHLSSPIQRLWLLLP